LTAKEKRSDTFKALMIALLAALVLRQFVLASYNVPTGSMKDTIMVGDFMFVNKFVYGARTPVWLGIPFTDIGVALPYFSFPAIIEPEQYDIIVFDWPEGIHLDYIKRCVAVGGQTVEVRGEKLFINNEPEGRLTPVGRKYDRDMGRNVDYTRVDLPNDDDNYVIRHVSAYNNRRNFGPITVPENQFFMMGDNRDNSLDSRSWGGVRRDQIGGKPLMIWFSWNGDAPAYKFYDKVRWDRLGMILR